MATPTPIPPELTTARATLQTQRAALVDALYQDDKAAQALRDAKRVKPDTTAEANALSMADTAVAQARSAITAAQTDLTLKITTWLTDANTPPMPLLPSADIGRLDATIPIVFFPVRIETRFETSTLKVRVYPDDIFLNSHETALTDAEQAAGQQYYIDLNKPNATDAVPKASWRDMVKNFGSQRAAYILRALLPDEFVDPLGFATIPTGENRGGPNGLTFPTVQNRPGTWTRPVEALLPDRWVVATRRGNTRNLFFGNTIPEPLPLTVDPSPQATQTQLANGLTVDDGSRWTVDFASAKQVGMGIEIALSSDDARLGFDSLIVFGVKTSLAPEDTAVALENLVDAHHYTSGMAFLRQDSPTNNTQDHPTSYPPADDAGTQSFAVERATPPVLRSTSLDVLPPDNPAEDDPVDGFFWTKLVGIPSGAVQNIDRALERETFRAQNMNAALWPLTYGSFLKFLMDPIITQTGIDNAQAYFANFNLNSPGGVFARGPAPAVRIGQVPYGLLPVASLRRWKAAPGDPPIEAKLLDPLVRLTNLWRSAASGVKRVNPNSSTPDLDLLAALSLDAKCRDARLRNAFGEFFLYNLFRLLSWDVAQGFAAFDKATSDLFQRMVGHPEWRPRIGRTLFFRDAPFVTTPFVDLDKNLSEDQPLSSDFIAGIHDALAPDLIANSLKPSQDSLLYELVRISALTELALELNRSLLTTPGYIPWINFEVFGLAGLPTTSIITTLKDPAQATTAAGLPIVVEYYTRLKALEGAPTAELDRLLRETLDLASHRLDAWVTAFATRRVYTMRNQQEGFPPPSYLGGYAWVENLRPATRTTTTGPDGGPVEVDPTNGGLIHCPGSQHAMAAAVLRNGYLSFKREDAQKYAFDLSSRQVRSGMQVLEEVRNGRHLGEVLGYRFERGLQEDHPGVPNLNALRFTFRTMFPLVAGKDGVDTSAPPDRAAAPNVVDGLALYRAFKAGAISFTGNPLPAPGTAAYMAITAELNILGQMLDGASDLLVAEGVYQLAGGNVTGAPASLDNLVRGGLPPEPSIAQSPRAGRGLTHRVVYVFQGQLALPMSWSRITATPRALAEPTLNAWLASILGDPQNVTATVHFTNSIGAAVQTGVSLAQLNIHPVDALALARAMLQPNQAGLLEARIIAVATDDPGSTKISVDYGPAAGRDVKTNRTFPEIVELLQTLGNTLGGSRPLAIEDLLAPSDVSGTVPLVETSASTNAQEIFARASAASKALDARTSALTGALSATPVVGSTLRQAIRSAGDVAPERAWASASQSAAALTDASNALSKELARRQAAVKVVTDALPQGPTPGSPPPVPAADLLQASLAILQAVFGTDVFVMPQVTPPVPNELNLSLGAQSTLLGSDTAVLGRFLQQAAHGRPQLAKYRKFSLYARALGSASPNASVVQLPFVPGEQWLGRDFPKGFEPSVSRISTILLSQAAQLDPQQTWTGIVLEGWTEIIPSLTQQTSIAFNFNGHGAEAPQAVLVMPSSGAGPLWDVNDIVATLEETLDLAKVRGVDLELLGSIGQAVPAIVIPNNADANISTSSGAFLQAIHLPTIFGAGFQ